MLVQNRSFWYNSAVSRNQKIIRTSLIGVAANIILAGLKMLVGLIAGSIAIVLDAVNNLTDVLSSVVTIVGAKLAARRPDQGHPYGHGRSEYISALMVGLIILMTGLLSLSESIPKIIHPELADYSWATITVVVLAVVVKIVLGLYVRKMGQKYNSRSLVGSGVDALFDAVLSLATLVGIIVTMVFGISIDGILGAIISVFILRTSIEIIMEASGDIMGRAVSQDLLRKIKQQICSFAPVSGVYDLMLHNYGPTELIGSVQIQVPDQLTARELHKLTREISQKVFTKFGVNLTIGIYADNSDCTANQAAKQTLLDIINDYPEIHQMHAFYVDEKDKLMTFDLVLAYDCGNTLKLKRQVVNAMKKKFPGYKFLVTIDFDLESQDEK